MIEGPKHSLHPALRGEGDEGEGVPLVQGGAEGAQRGEGGGGGGEVEGGEGSGGATAEKDGQDCGGRSKHLRGQS